MLILSRRNGESFVIGDNIKITVLSQRSNQVRIGIDAPRDLPVFREEVLERRKQSEQPTPAETLEHTVANSTDTITMTTTITSSNEKEEVV